jgi:hypothetical protein
MPFPCSSHSIRVTQQKNRFPCTCPVSSSRRKQIQVLLRLRKRLIRTANASTSRESAGDADYFFDRLSVSCVGFHAAIIPPAVQGSLASMAHALSLPS